MDWTYNWILTINSHVSIFEEIRDSADGRELSERWYRYKVKQVMGTRGSFRGVMADSTLSIDVI